LNTKYTILTASIVIPLVIFGVFLNTTNFLKNNSELVIKTGWFGGFCYGYCIGDVKLTSEKIVFHSNPKVPLNSPCTEVTKEIPFTKEEFQSLIDLVDLEKFNELPDVVSSSTHVDIGNSWIEISDGNNAKKIIFTTINDVPEIQEFATELMDLIIELKSQYLTPASICFEEITENGNEVLEIVE